MAGNGGVRKYEIPEPNDRSIVIMGNRHIQRTHQRTQLFFFSRQLPENSRILSRRSDGISAALNRYLLIAILPAIKIGTLLGIYGNDAAAITAAGVLLLFVAGFWSAGRA